MSRRSYSIDDVKKAVANNLSIAGVLRQLGLKPIGGNYRTINRIVADKHIDTSHFTGQGWNVGLKFKPKRELMDADIFVENSNYKCSWRLRERYKNLTGESKCASCGLSEWLGQPIPLEIHHINGNNRDNRLSNLTLLCPNCHAQTDNYRGRGKKDSN